MCTRTLRDTEKKMKIDKKILKRNSDKILASVGWEQILYEDPAP